jgi:hypothetical protein
MEVKSFKAKSPIQTGHAQILACQTFDDPPEDVEWVPCKAEDVIGMEALMLRKGALMLGKI